MKKEFDAPFIDIFLFGDDCTVTASGDYPEAVTTMQEKMVEERRTVTVKKYTDFVF